MSKMTVATLNTKIESHEAVCAERWLEVINRVKRLEHFIAVSYTHLTLPTKRIV